jgi:UDP-GlcNAc3NAcA epimerase
LGIVLEKMLKILTIVGARPQFVKAAALSREFKKYSEIKEVIIHTGQHFDENMSSIFFSEMEIPAPAYNLNINGLGHGAMTGQMLEGIEKIIITEKPDFVLVYGDTNSTIAGALAAKKLHVKVIHVEAGLRSFNMQMPEEINRILTDRISDFLFCPTDTAVQNLKNEGYDNIKATILKCGDVMEDTARYYAIKSDSKSTIMSHLNLANIPFILGTIHRAENTDNPENLRNIVQALNQINEHTKVVVPIHPRTKKIIENNQLATHFTITEPLGYFDMITLLKNSSMVITDSGGLQKEAFFFRKYCITMREQTEWVELVTNGYNFIAGTNLDTIFSHYQKLINQNFPPALNLYGDGGACKSICDAIMNLNK